MILPGCISPICTRYAPTSTTAARPVFSRKLTVGPTFAIVTSAVRCLAISSPLISSKLSRSHAVRDSARITRAPAMFSCTLRTITSCACCTRVNSGTPLRLSVMITKPSSGSAAAITSVSTGSSASATIMPPISIIGARTPSRCMRSIIWCTL